MEESSSLENTVWMLYNALESRCLMNDTSIALYHLDVCVWVGIVTRTKTTCLLVGSASQK